MKDLAHEMAKYAAYHNDATNRAIHYVFVPLIVWSLMGLLSIPGSALLAGIPLTLAYVVAAPLLVYYLRLDFAYGVAMAILFTVGLTTAWDVTQKAGSLALPFFGTVFVLSWLAQVVSHFAFEGRKPALADDLKQVFVAPLFVVAEWSFSLGLRKQLQEQVHQKMVAYMPKIREEDLPGRPLEIRKE